MIPFSAEVFFSVLAEYNRSIWPVQAVALLLGFAAVFLTVRPTRHSGGITACVLAAAWIWCGAVYHFGTFAGLSFWDYPIGALFLGQGLLFLWFGFVRHGFVAAGRTRRMFGTAMMIFALAVHPMISFGIGQSVEQLTTVGTAPVPTILFTLGVLSAWSVTGRVWHWSLALLLSAVYLIPAAMLPVPEDWSLIPGALAAIAISRSRA